MSDAGDDTRILPDPHIGRTLGRCTLEKKLGQGGMGAVYLAHHASLDIKVAVKVLPEGLAQLADWRKRFAREARVAARLDHPHAVRVMDVECDDAIPYLVMELVRGKSLGGVLKQSGAIPWKEAVRMIRQAAEALAAAHEIGLVHRDIKPDNLMLADGGQVKVADFGLARNVTESSEATMAGQMQGSPDYLAPEQGGGMKVDGRADVYSLGVTLHALVTGGPAYRRDSAISTITANFTEPLPPLGPGFPPALDVLLGEMTVKHPDQRKIAMATVVKRLAAIEAGSPRKAGGRTGVAAAKPASSNAWLGGGLGALALAIVAAVILGRGGAPDDPVGPGVAKVTPPPPPTPTVPASTGSGSGSTVPAPPPPDPAGSELEVPPRPVPIAKPAFADFLRVLAGIPLDRQIELLDGYLDGAADGLDRTAAQARRDAVMTEWAAVLGREAAVLIDGHVARADFEGARRQLDASSAPSRFDSPAWDTIVRAARARLIEATGRALAERGAEIDKLIAAGELDRARTLHANLVTLGDPELERRAADWGQRIDVAIRQRASATSIEARTAAFEARLAAAHAILARRDVPAALAAYEALRTDDTAKAFLAKAPIDPRVVELDAVRRFHAALADALPGLAGKTVSIDLETGEMIAGRVERAAPEALEVAVAGKPTRVAVPSTSWAQRARWADAHADPFAIAVTLRTLGAGVDAGPWILRARAAGHPDLAAWLAAPLVAADLPAECLATPVPSALSFKLKAATVTADAYAGAWQPLWKTPVGGALDAIAVDPEGRWIAVAGELGVIYTLKATDGTRVFTSESRERPLRTLEYHTKTRQLVGSDPDHYVIAGWDGKRWNLRIVDTGCTINAIAFSPDGSQAAVGCNDARVYDTASWKAPRTLGNAGMLGDTSAIAWHPNGAIVAVGHAKGRLQLYRAADGEALKGMAAPTDLHTLVFGDKGRLLVGASEHGDVGAWDATSGATLFLRKNPASVGGDKLPRIALSTDGRLLAWAAADHVQVWETGGWTLLRRFLAHDASVTDLAFVGDRLVTASTDGTVRCWGLPK